METDSPFASYRGLMLKQGFDEFMNLVIDEAVEVKQATKTEGESRKKLGKQRSRVEIGGLLDTERVANSCARANSAKGRQRVAGPDGR